MITALPTPPTRSDPASFSTRADAFMQALPTFATEANALQTDVNNQQVQAALSAATATAQANAAEALVAAVKWVSGNTYATDSSAWSPINQATYRRLSPGGVSTVDPSLDNIGWVKVTPDSFPQFILLQQGII